MSAKRYIKLTPKEDEQLRKVEQTAGLGAKVKLRATILRLSNQGWDIERLVQYIKRSRWSILRDFDRWEAQGIKVWLIEHHPEILCKSPRKCGRFCRRNSRRTVRGTPLNSRMK